MKMLRVRLGQWWRPLVCAIGAAIGAGLLFSYQLAALAPRLSPTEQATVAASGHYQYLLNNPANLPQKLLTWLALKLPHIPLLWQARLPSVIMALASLALATYILHHWYGRRSMIIGLAIFASSAWLLHVGRFASPDIEYFLAIVALVAAHISLRDHEDSAAAWYVWLGVHATTLCIPGMIWFVLLSVSWQWRAIIRAWTEQGTWQRLVSVAIPALILAGIAVAIVRNPALLLPWLGLPGHIGVSTLSDEPRHLLDAALFVVLRGPHRPELWLGQLPLLGGFMLVMFAAGILFYALHWRAGRAQMLASYLLLSVVLSSLSVVSVSVIVPFLYLIAVAGIAYVLHFWLREFPRNPIARTVGIGLITILVGVSCGYTLVEYFIAWPHNPEVVQVYHTRP